MKPIQYIRFFAGWVGFAINSFIEGNAEEPLRWLFFLIIIFTLDYIWEKYFTPKENNQ